MSTDARSSSSCWKSRTESWRSCCRSVGGRIRLILRSQPVRMPDELASRRRRLDWFWIWGLTVCISCAYVLHRNGFVNFVLSLIPLYRLGHWLGVSSRWASTRCFLLNRGWLWTDEVIIDDQQAQNFVLLLKQCREVLCYFSSAFFFLLLYPIFLSFCQFLTPYTRS